MALIERLHVDVACFQELTAPLAEAIARVLPEGALSPNPDGRGLGIACRKPASVENFSLRYRDGWIARLSPRDWRHLERPIEVVNVHLMAPHTWPYFPRASKRRVQLADLLGFLDQDPSMPRAIVGDFNASPAWPLYKRMASRYLDAAVACRNGVRPPPTWPHLPFLGIRGILRIDHCFVSHLTPKESRVLAIPGSDHLGLCIDLQINQAAS